LNVSAAVNGVGPDICVCRHRWEHC